MNLVADAVQERYSYALYNDNASRREGFWTQTETHITFHSTSHFH